MRNLVIIGTGPAGLTAAISTAGHKHNVLEAPMVLMPDLIFEIQ